MKTKDELYQKVRFTPRMPRVVLKPNSQIGLQDQLEHDARTSYDQPSGSKSSWETGCDTVDYRISGVPLSAVEQQDTNRKDTAKKLIEKSENHPKKESFFQDFQQTKEINKFSEKSQELIADMNNTEMFELSELAMLSRRITRAVPDVDLLNDNEFVTKRKKCCINLVQKKHGKHSSNPARWHNDHEYRKSLSEIGWTEENRMLFDRIALENHSYVATRAE